jgi:hypothetical protein
MFLLYLQFQFVPEVVPGCMLPAQVLFQLFLMQDGVFFLLPAGVLLGLLLLELQLLVVLDELLVEI